MKSQFGRRGRGFERSREQLREELAAPSYAPYPSTVPFDGPSGGESTPWWSEQLLLRHLGGLSLLRMYTQPVGAVQ